MILTVTLNPLLERRYYIDSLNRSGNHRSKASTLSAGGKGINVSRQLNQMNTANLAYTFLGGINGKYLRNILAEEKINFTHVQTRNETRDGVLIIEDGGRPVTTVFGANHLLHQEEVDEFKSRLKKMIENSEIVVFSGSSPSSNANDIFPFGIETANEFDKISILDTYGSHLRKCIDSVPTIIHNNVSELNHSLQIDLSSEPAKLKFLHDLFTAGIKQTYLTDGTSPVYASNFDFLYKVEIPEVDEIDSTGSGDAFTAGIAYGLHNSLTFEESFKTALSLGSLNASRSSVCNIPLSEIDSMKDKFTIMTIGKKIKNII